MAAPALEAPAAVATDSLPTFASISHLLSPPILLALSSLRFSHPTPVQSQVLPLALSGHDIVARARTGSGKTLAYGLPIVQKIIKAKEAQGRASTDYQRTRALILVPTRELAEQVTTHVGRICQSSNEEVSIANVARDASSSSTHKLILADRPDIVVATPSAALKFVQSKALPLTYLDSLVMDEADLLLSYGHDSAVRTLFSSNVLPTTYQSYLMSATMSQDVEELRGLLAAGGRKATVLNLKDPTHHAHLRQYYVYLSEESKFLLLYVLLRLRLVRGKCLIFVNDVDRGYKVRLFLEAFGIKSCVLNAEMPANSRYHVVQEFNKGVYDVIIATDEASEDVGAKGDDDIVRGDEEEEEATADADPAPGSEEAEEEDDDEVDGQKKLAGQATSESTSSTKKRKHQDNKKDGTSSKRSSRSASQREYGVSRGIDFVSVSCVINFDLPLSLSSYIHRIGRTARGHSTGIALSFVVPKKELHVGASKGMKGVVSSTAKYDERTWRKITRHMKRAQRQANAVVPPNAASSSTLVTPGLDGAIDLREWAVHWPTANSFRYRIESVLQSASSRSRVREARIEELKREMLRSARLRAHFEENPRDWEYLKHDRALGEGGANGRGAGSQKHLKHVPNYLIPAGMGGGRRGGVGAAEKLEAPPPAPDGDDPRSSKMSKVSYDEQGRSLGYVGLRKQKRGGGASRGRGRGRGGSGGSSGGRKKDPLRVGSKRS